MSGVYISGEPGFAEILPGEVNDIYSLEKLYKLEIKNLDKNFIRVKVSISGAKELQVLSRGEDDNCHQQGPR